MGNKKGFFKRNKESIKVGCIAGVSLCSIGAICALIVAHIANPALGFVTLPIAVQALVATIIKKAPRTYDDLKGAIMDVLQDESEEMREKFADEVLSQYSSRAQSARTTVVETREPIDTPSEVEEVIIPARYHKKSNVYDVYTPRPPQEKRT